MMLKNIEDLARKFKYHKPRLIQTIIGQLNNEPNMAAFQKNQVDYVVMEDCKFYPSEHLNSLVKFEGNDDWFKGTKATDTVLDIGACIGSVTIPLAKKVKFVYAVEPLYYEELRQNASLNDLTNVKVFPCAVGDIRDMRVTFGSRSRIVPVASIKHLRETIGQINFVKVDIEGGEWNLKPEDFEGIREIRIEFHYKRWHESECEFKFTNWLVWFSLNKYKLAGCHHLEESHESSLQFSRVRYLSASKAGD